MLKRSIFDSDVAAWEKKKREDRFPTGEKKKKKKKEREVPGIIGSCVCQRRRHQERPDRLSETNIISLLLYMVF